MNKMWVILITFVATASVAGGGTYYCMDKRAQDEKSNLRAQIDDLDAKYNKVKEELSLSQSEETNTTESQPSTATSTTTNNASKTTLNKDIENIAFPSIISVNTKMDDALLTPSYADLNGDNSEEALVTYKYGGTGAYIDFYIYGMKNGNATQLYKKSDLKSGTATIKSNSVYADYSDPNSSVNKNVSEADQQIDVHKKYTWNGSTYIESNQ